MRYSTFELKYCERCGGLGLRREHSGLPYCRDCEHILEHLLLRRGAPSKPAFGLGGRKQPVGAPLVPGAPFIPNFGMTGTKALSGKNPEAAHVC